MAAKKDTPTSESPLKDSMISVLAEISAEVEAGVITTKGQLKGKILKSVHKI